MTTGTAAGVLASARESKTRKGRSEKRESTAHLGQTHTTSVERQMAAATTQKKKREREKPGGKGVLL